MDSPLNTGWILSHKGGSAEKEYWHRLPQNCLLSAKGVDKYVAKLENRDIEQSAAKTAWFSNGCTLMTIASGDWTFCRWCWGIPETAGFSNSSYIWTWWGKRDRELPIWCKSFSRYGVKLSDELTIRCDIIFWMTRSCRFCFHFNWIQLIIWEDL